MAGVKILGLGGGPVRVGGNQEHGLGQVELARRALHQVGLEATGIGEYGDRVALQGHIGEHVDDHVGTH